MGYYGICNEYCLPKNLERAIAMNASSSSGNAAKAKDQRQSEARWPASACGGGRVCVAKGREFDRRPEREKK